MKTEEKPKESRDSKLLGMVVVGIPVSVFFSLGENRIGSMEGFTFWPTLFGIAILGGYAIREVYWNRMPTRHTFLAYAIAVLWGFIVVKWFYFPLMHLEDKEFFENPSAAVAIAASVSAFLVGVVVAAPVVWIENIRRVKKMKLARR